MAFTLRIFKSELEEIERFVVKYPNIETGGDLFGLWTANGDPVVQLIIGPGKNCKRTSVSFHQDTDYLGTVGRFVNSSYMLCHIGSWHSHHQLSLTQPSAGDRSTVCNNFPVGLQRYIMIIANIERGQFVKLHPYMFTKEGHVCRQGKVQKISGASPFREDGYVLDHLVCGAEKHSITYENAYLSRVQDHYHQQSSTNLKLKNSASKIGDSEKYRSSEHSANTNFKALNPQSHSPRKFGISGNDKSPRQPSPQSKVPSFKSHSPTRFGFSKYHESFDEPSACLRSVNSWTKSSNIESRSSDVCHEPMDIDSSGDDRDSSVACRQPHYRYPESSKTSKSHHHGSHLQGTSLVANIEDTNDETQWYDTKEGGTKLKEIVQLVESTNIARDVEYSRDVKSKNLVMKFRHASQTWTIVFPRAFDNDAALISSGSGEAVPSRNIIHDLRKVCKCGICLPHKGDCQPSYPKQNDEVLLTPQTPRSSSKKYHSSSRRGHYTPYPTTMPSRRFAESPTQPWYNSSSGKDTFEQIKFDIETFSNTSCNIRVQSKETSYSKEIIFYHGHFEWVVEFLNSNKDINLYIKEHGKKRLMTIVSPPYDILSALQQHCTCTKFRLARRPRSGQSRSGSTRPRPNSRYATINHPTPTFRRINSPSCSKFFATENGERKFGRIHTDICANFPERGNIDISRVASKDIEMTFEHHRKKWKITFPYEFPAKSPKLGYNSLFSPGRFHDVPVNRDVIHEIRRNCNCRPCLKHRFKAS